MVTCTFAMEMRKLQQVTGVTRVNVSIKCKNNQN